MFKQWSDSVESRIVVGKQSYYDLKLKSYDSAKDTVVRIPVTSKHSLSRLKQIKDIVYIGSFGHGKEGKFWWGSGTGSSKQYHTVGFSNVRYNSPNAIDKVPLSIFNLDYNRCGFVIELYHCRTGEKYAVTSDNELMFDDTSAQPRLDTNGGQSVASLLKIYLKEVVTGVPFKIGSSEKPVNNGWPLNRGYPRPTGKIIIEE